MNGDQNGFAVLGGIIALVLLIGSFIVFGYYIPRTASINSIKNSISKITVPAGVSLQQTACNTGDFVDQASGNCTYTYSTQNQVGYSSFKQAILASGYKDYGSSEQSAHFIGGNPDLNLVLDRMSNGQIRLYVEHRQ